MSSLLTASLTLIVFATISGCGSGATSSATQSPTAAPVESKLRVLFVESFSPGVESMSGRIAYKKRLTIWSDGTWARGEARVSDREWEDERIVKRGTMSADDLAGLREVIERADMELDVQEVSCAATDTSRIVISANGTTVETTRLCPRLTFKQSLIDARELADKLSSD